MHHEAGHYLALLECPQRLQHCPSGEVLEELETRASGFAPLAAKCCGRTPAKVFHDTDFKEQRTLSSEMGVHQGDALNLALFWMPLGTRLIKLCQRFEPLGSEAFAYE